MSNVKTERFYCFMKSVAESLSSEDEEARTASMTFDLKF